jgi:group I intron endonuclease
MTKIAGVYIIQSIGEPSKIYVGSSFDINKRKSEHFRNLRKGKHANIKLQYFYNKYGESNLVFEIIESSEYFNKNHLLAREQGWYSHFSFGDMTLPYFNICPIAGSPMKGRRATRETRERLSKIHKGRKNTPEHCESISKGLMGHEVSEETRRKLKENSGTRGKTPWNKGIPISDDARRKNSEAHKGKTAWNKGLKGCYTSETLKKMSKVHKGHDTWNKGKTGVYSEETLRKIGEASKKRRPFKSKKGTKQTREHIEKRLASIRRTLDLKRKQKNAA